MTVSKTIVAVPEPTTLAMVALGRVCSSACNGSAENCAKSLSGTLLRVRVSAFWAARTCFSARQQ